MLMEYTEQYPVRVTLGTDGIYRWSRRINISRGSDTYILFRRIMLVICGAVFAVSLFFSFLVRDFSMVWIPLVCCGFVLLISLPLCRLILANADDHSSFILAYEMSDEAILMIRNPAALPLRINGPALITMAVRSDLEHPLESSAGSLYQKKSSEFMLTRFQNVRSVCEVSEESRLVECVKKTL